MHAARMSSVTQPTSPASCRGSSGVCVVESSLETAARLSGYVAGCTGLRWPCRGHPPVSTVYFHLKKNGPHWTGDQRKTSQTGRENSIKLFYFSLLSFWFAELEAERGFPPHGSIHPALPMLPPHDVWCIFSTFFFFTPPPSPLAFLKFHLLEGLELRVQSWIFLAALG